MTSFYPVCSLVKEEISGDHNEVWLVRSGAGIHDYEPSARRQPNYMMDKYAILKHSDLGLDVWSLADSTAGHIEASKGVEFG